jgi:hypothetical protein
MTSTSNPVAAFWKRLGGQNQIILAAGGGVVIFAIIIVLIIRVAASLNSPPPPSPAQQAAERTVQQFYTDVEQQGYSAAWNLFTMQQQLPWTEYAFAKTLEGFNQTYGPITAFHEIRYDKDTNTAGQVFIQESVTRHMTYTVEVTLRQQADGTWKLNNELAQHPSTEPSI